MGRSLTNRSFEQSVALPTTIVRRGAASIVVAVLVSCSLLIGPGNASELSKATLPGLKLDLSWLLTVAQAATPPNDHSDPVIRNDSRPFAGGAVLTPISPIDPALKAQADALSVWRTAVDNAPTPTPANGSPPSGVSNAAPAVQGVTANEIRFGMSSAFSGAAKESGHNLMVGVETAFDQVNEAGGISGRQLKLVAEDDGYEPARTTEAMGKLYERDKVFGFICNFGTATATVAAPFALEHKMLFFGAFTGSNVLRRDPPDRYVFNYRAAYGEETAAILHYLVMVRRFRPDQIVVFAQDDGFGDAGYDGVQKEVRRLYGAKPIDILSVGVQEKTPWMSRVLCHRSMHAAIR